MRSVVQHHGIRTLHSAAKLGNPKAPPTFLRRLQSASRYLARRTATRVWVGGEDGHWHRRCWSAQDSLSRSATMRPLSLTPPAMPRILAVRASLCMVTQRVCTCLYGAVFVCMRASVGGRVGRRVGGRVGAREPVCVHFLIRQLIGRFPCMLSFRHFTFLPDFWFPCFHLSCPNCFPSSHFFDSPSFPILDSSTTFVFPGLNFHSSDLSVSAALDAVRCSQAPL